MVIFCSECFRQVRLVKSAFGFSLVCPCGMRRGFDYRELQPCEARSTSTRGHVYYFAQNRFRDYGDGSGSDAAESPGPARGPFPQSSQY